MPDLLDQLPAALEIALILIPIIVLIVVVAYLASPHGRDLDQPSSKPVALERKPAGQDRLTRDPRTGMAVGAPTGPDPVQPAVPAGADDHLSGAQTDEIPAVHAETVHVPAVRPPVPTPKQLPRDPQDPDRETRAQRRRRQDAERAAQAQAQKRRQTP